MKSAIEIISFGPKALLLNWPQHISEEINTEISACNLQINKYFKDLLIESVCTYCSLTLYLKQPHTSELIAKIQSLLSKRQQYNTQQKPSTWTIPVCYDLSFGIDLQRVADTHELTIDDVINLHAKPLYHVYFLGFLPGFPYLGGLDERLITPRLASPRWQIPKGSVAIGNQQTGVYPSNSPGGWNIIGRTPVNLFDSQNPKPSFLNAGDKIQFYSVNLKDYETLSESFANKLLTHENLKGGKLTHD